jgi:hypothetical protein
MVHVTFYNLLRSKYRITELVVTPGTIHEIIQQIIDLYPNIKQSDLHSAIVFYQSKPIHYHQFHRTIDDHSSIIFTHFVGGG